MECRPKKYTEISPYGMFQATLRTPDGVHAIGTKLYLFVKQPSGKSLQVKRITLKGGIVEYEHGDHVFLASCPVMEVPIF